MSKRKRKGNCKKLKKQKISFKSKAGAVNYEFIFQTIPPEGEKIVLGLCDHPKSPDPQIIINIEQDEKEAIATAIHEILHAIFWNRREDWIRNRELQIINALWKMGVRLPTWED